MQLEFTGQKIKLKIKQREEITERENSRHPQKDLLSM